MTAPLSLREYMAAAGSAFTKADAEVIGPQLEAMAEEGDLSTGDEGAAKRTIVDTARSENSPLHRFFVWDDARAADMQRLDHAGKMLRSIRVRFIDDDRPKTMPAYKITRAQPKTVLQRGHNVLHGDSAVAVRKAKDAFDELTSWRARYSPYVVVWKGFADVFRAVTNQIGEAQGAVHVAALDDATDAALSDMSAVVDQCLAWQAKHDPVARQWSALAEQAGFMVEAIDAADATFGAVKLRDRPCLRCGKMFASAGVGNRLCERCSVKGAN